MLIETLSSEIITFVSKLYAVSISDKELTCCSGIMDLSQPGDSMMANHGFTIQNDLAFRGVKKGKVPTLRVRACGNKKELYRLESMLNGSWNVLRILTFLIELYFHP